MDSSASLVDLIFRKCTLVYGRDFLNRWEGMSIGEVKADWERDLGMLLNNPQAVKHALMHLPADRPPTVLQFKNLCINLPRLFAPALDAPRASTVVAAAAMAAVRKVLQPASQHPKAWAHKLHDQERDGRRLTATVKAMMRSVAATEDV